jgi:hypothetical protein
MSEPTSTHDQFDPDLEGQLAALADGRLDVAKRAALEVRIGAEPALAQALADQRLATRVISAAAASVDAPHDLRMRIDRAARPSQRRRRFWLPAGGLAGAAAAAAVTIVVLTAGEELTVRGAVAAGTRPPEGEVSFDSSNDPVLRDRVEQVLFPNFGGKFGWTPVGVRADRIDSRDTRTVFYERGGKRLAYTIVAGAAVDQPGDATVSTTGGVELRTFTEKGRRVVTWQRQGHTCVMSGIGVADVDLATLASWKGKGAVSF